MYNPPHPGEIIKELCLEPLGISVTTAAEGLGVSRKTLQNKLKEYGIKAGYDVEIITAVIESIQGYIFFFWTSSIAEGILCCRLF